MKRTTACIALLATLFAPVSWAEETPWYPLGAPGILLADLSPQLYLSGVEEADPGMVLVEASNGRDYRITGLPDLDAGDSDTYSLSFTYNGAGYTYYWPSRTRTPQAVVNKVSYRVTQDPWEYTEGATIPSISLEITGLSSDPTGSTVTFSMWRIGGTKVLDGVTASAVDVDSLVDGTYTLTVQHDWLTSETSTAGTYYARFTVMFPSGAVASWPPAPSKLNIRVYEGG